MEIRMIKIARPWLVVVVFVALAFAAAPYASSAAGTAASESIQKAATGSHRSEANIARNRYRHPVETLEFFGLEEDMTVLEILPGSLWYSEVIGPVVRERGQFKAASYDPDAPDQPEYRAKQVATMQQRFAAEKNVFGDAEILVLAPPDRIELGEPGSVDMVLTFRNLHGFVRAGVTEQVLRSFYDVLKPGGVLGVVQHRAGEATTKDPDAFVGYLPQDRVVQLVESAGFELEAQSEINANPKDTADYPKGVWTLPPSYTLGDVDRARYEAIGESDRMTLRFRKPAR
jgi:predicted methyltransferase